MTLNIALQMDCLKDIDIKGDSTFSLALEAQRRGYNLFHYDVDDMSMRDGHVFAYCRPVIFKREKGNHFTAGDEIRMDLESDIDVVLMRQDPPFHMGYITATHLLEQIHPKTLVVNNPSSVRNAPEKIFLTRFPDLMPPTLITRSKKEVIAFRDEFKDIIIKPLYGNGGAGVFRLRPEDQNLSSLVEMFQDFYPEAFIVQKYLSDVRSGDKRIILVDGVAVGAINRIPPEGEARSNMHVGGVAVQTKLTSREQEICDAIGPVLKEQGQAFVGIDVIGDYLTEINVTSPTGIQEIQRFDGTDVAALIWDAIEGHIEENSA